MKVLQPGLFSSIQDYGRFGNMKFGVPVSGVMDRYAARTANLMLRNDANDSVLEITMMGPKLEFSVATKIVISGAYLSPKLNGEEVENNEIIEIAAGDILRFGRRILGCRAYLAISGGFTTEEVLGSKSWYESITEFSKLEKGMEIAFNEDAVSKIETNASLKFEKSYLESNEVEVDKGPEFDALSESQKEVLRTSAFSIDQNNNRMAIQLKEQLENNLDPIITGPVLPGTVQLTPSGKLIVLMMDCQTTGGYPRVLQLTSNGINAIAQKLTNEKVKFSFEESI
ncbi:biotin-dependent carboxyltransferase family protein [Zunongwangia endophytica]|uniref:Biotin-dependent carboxyltransferase family protein n=1 Tax=Zunongwangia endophytica TaxID=1808945 RepID=A0ABV8HBK4_9FLAO|nr:biotin-dependent carboxyltransferase family protein [Zunongwangia endophytica]MDN3593590.1 biotin-dependent carboxyltransferase family protein [Zunongwangia endophytica]